jgi:hypothetical protein
MATTRSITNKALVTGIAYMDTREINPNLIDAYNETGLDDILQLTGRYKKTEQPSYHYFTNEALLQVLVIDAGGVTGSGTATVALVITTTGFARRGGKYKFANGKVGYISTAVVNTAGKDSFSVKSVDGTNLTAVAGDKIASLGITVGEGSDDIQPLNYGQTKYFNLVEHLKDKTQITDIQKGSKIEVGTGYYAYLQAINQAASFKKTISATLIAGVKSVNEYGTASPTIVDENGNSMQTTGGLDGEITAYGVNDAVATPGTVIMADVDDLLDQLNAVNAPSDYLMLSPDSAWRKYDDMTKNLGSSGVTSARLNMDGKEVDYNIKRFSKGRFNLEFGALRLLDDPTLFNFVGASAIGKTIYGFPKDRVKVQAGPGGAGGMEARIGVRYMPNQQVGNGQGTDIVREWYIDALASTPTSAKEVLTCYVSTTQGLEALGVRQMFKQRVLV